MLDIKTVIELFDACQIKNVIASLSLKPEKVVIVGFKEVMKQRKINDLKNFFRKRNLKIEIQIEYVGRYDYNSVVDRLNQIIDDNPDCCFDLTGGKELVIAAMGEVSSKRNIPMIYFNINTNNLIRIKNCDRVNIFKKESISTEENIILNGGSIIKDENNTFSLNADFINDVEKMWNINCNSKGGWNRFSKFISNAEYVKKEKNGLYVEVDLSLVEESKKEALFSSGIIEQFINVKLISKYEKTQNRLKFKLKNEQIYKCIVKAGNILELYAYMILKDMLVSDRNDIRMGVIVDWDGIVNGRKSPYKDTRNEIDVFMTRGFVPVFISCKNGEVTKEALYELDTVAEKFGGEVSKKVLLTTYVSKDAEARKFIIQRAFDMKIEIIEGIDDLSKEELKIIFKKRILK